MPSRHFGDPSGTACHLPYFSAKNRGGAGPPPPVGVLPLFFCEKTEEELAVRGFLELEMCVGLQCSLIGFKFSSKKLSYTEIHILHYEKVDYHNIGFDACSCNYCQCEKR